MQDYNAFRFRAVVDFIEIQIQTAYKTKYETVRKWCAVSYAKPLDREFKGGAASVFKIRLYDLKNFKALQAKIDDIERHFALERSPFVTMVEVAFDAYRHPGIGGATPDPLAAMAAHMVYRLANPVSDNRRTYDSYRHSPQAIPRGLASLTRDMAGGQNVAIGNTTDDQYQHGYLKDTDHNGIPFLLQSDHRARFEIRLAGAALPVQTLDDWRSFKFESLATHISFRKEIEAPTPYERMIVAARANSASHRRNIKRRAGGGVRAYLMPADVELNRIVRQQLLNLTRRWTPDKRLPTRQ